MTDRPWSHEIPDTHWDYVVIGSGMGGMVAAAMLSKLGRRVLVLEQHNIPGGFTQMFKRPGYRWDVGVHIVGEMSDKSYLGRLLQNLTDGRLQWESVGGVYDEFNFPDGFSIQLPDSRERFRETLIDYFPAERDAIDQYLTAVRAAARSTSKFLQSRATPRMLSPGGRKRAADSAGRYLGITTAEMLASLTDDVRLRAVLSAQWGYYGATPAKSSFAMHAMMVQHFLRGAYYPVGGSTSIAYGLLGTVAEAGGWTAVRRSVDEILVQRGSVTGVRLSDGTEVPAKRVISAAGAIPTSNMLEQGLPATGEPYREAGPAHVSLYLGFKGDIAAHGAERYCQWYFDSWDMEVEGWDISPDRPIGPSPVLFCSFPSLKDPMHDPGPVQRNTGEVITFVPWESFSRWSGTRWKRRGADYDAFKDELTKTLLDQYLMHYPELARMVDHAEMSTPLSTSHFAASARGSIYGLGTTPERFGDVSLLPRTSIRGLYLGGVDVSTPGVAGGLSGGVMAALAAEPLKGARFLQPLMRRPTV
ncbi:MAG TPA: NAD(P)/FAD-dependent oxidoreductase [Acidimicrobiia bacterium]|nr:NAD(P)/FAD-dependent oxidoreductase [Acidimicrobiia bacterium]